MGDGLLLGIVQAKKSPHSAGLVVDENVLCVSLFTFRHKTNLYTLTECTGRAGESGQRHACVVLVQGTVNRCAAGMHAFSEGFLCNVLRLHRFSDLPGNHALKSGCGNLFYETLLGQEVVEVRTDMFVHV